MYQKEKTITVALYQRDLELVAMAISVSCTEDREDLKVLYYGSRAKKETSMEIFKKVAYVQRSFHLLHWPYEIIYIAILDCSMAGKESPRIHADHTNAFLVSVGM